jgi:hypothetical protein
VEKTMKKIILVGIATFLATAIVLFGILTPVRTVECYREHTFVIDRDFKDVRRAYCQQDLVKEVLEAHGAKLISKNWIKHDFTIKMPLRTSWEYSGTMLIVAKLNCPRETMHMKQEISLRPTEMYAKTNLDRPLEIGVTDWDQEILIVPYGDRTKVEIKLHTRLSRFIPRIFMETAKDQMNFAADDMIAKLQPLLTELGMKNGGFIDFAIPVRP